MELKALNVRRVCNECVTEQLEKNLEIVEFAGETYFRKRVRSTRSSTRILGANKASKGSDAPVTSFQVITDAVHSL